jgi:hypothetical protein
MGITVLSPVPPTPTLATTLPNDVALTPAVIGSSALASRADHAHKVADTGWLNVTLLNGWTLYTDSNFGNTNALYRRIAGIVFMRGLIVSTSASSGTAFNLPVGFRPITLTHLFIGYCDNGANRYDVQASGDTILPTGRGWVSLTGIIFPAEQ